jgi:hypothetical protein
LEAKIFLLEFKSFASRSENNTIYVEGRYYGGLRNVIEDYENRAVPSFTNDLRVSVGIKYKIDK